MCILSLVDLPDSLSLKHACQVIHGALLQRCTGGSPAPPSAVGTRQGVPRDETPGPEPEAEVAEVEEVALVGGYGYVAFTGLK